MAERAPADPVVLEAMTARRPDLSPCVPALLAAHDLLVACFAGGGTLYTCGNGGSHADAVHIVGELCKSFARRRRLDAQLTDALQPLAFGPELAEHLEAGLRSHALGLNGALKTAVENDSPLRDVAFAQELNALGREGDVLLALSTSGNAANCRMAMSVARARGMAVVTFTGPGGGAMAQEADVAVRAPGESTPIVQEAHATLWHTLCLLAEASFFPEPR